MTVSFFYSSASHVIFEEFTWRYMFDVSFPSPIYTFYYWLISCLAFEIWSSHQLNLNMSLCNDQLEKVVNALPRRLVVFVTHHHHDHVDGESLFNFIDLCFLR